MKPISILWLLALACFIGAHTVPAQTNVSIAPAGSQMILFWPITLTNGILQSTTNLSSTNWLAVSNAVPVTAVIISNTGPAQFFRYFQVVPVKSTTADGMALVPAGPFTMGDTLDGESDAIPVTNVNLSGFYMDTNLVSYAQWQSVYAWAGANGYGFDDPGNGKAANQPVYNVEWYDVLKWANARSQIAGLTPVYYTDAGFTQTYTNGDTDAVYPNWSASGYRLPTEAEWEKAARGGLSGQRFPLGLTIAESQANYYGCTSCNSYDLGPNGQNAGFSSGGYPYTSPVGSFPPNGHGLYDLDGNVFEWCWDWYATPYAGGTDPRGPAAPGEPPFRVLRGGAWNEEAVDARCANRDASNPDYENYNIGFRCARAVTVQ